MAIQYRCQDCDQLISIASRMAGRTVNCPTCGVSTLVPPADNLLPVRSPVAEPPQPAPKPELEHSSDHKPATANRRTDVEDDHDEGAAFVLRRSRTSEDEMDLTPMVDVTFLLLIFFILTASMSLQKAIEVPRPDVDKQGATQTPQTLAELEESSIRVSVDAENTIFVDDAPVEGIAMLPEALQKAIDESDRRELLLSADDLAFHETIVAVYDAANLVGLQKIRLVSRAAD